MSIRVSVVIPTYNRLDYLERCVRALLTQEFPPEDFEVIIVDDAANDRTKQEVEEWARKAHLNNYTIRYLSGYQGTRKHHGPASARNLGWRSAQADIIAFTDDDCIPEQRWLQMGIAAFQEEVACVSGRVVVPLHGIPTEYAYGVGKTSQKEFITASCFYRRTVLEQTGGFDERFTTPSYEDHDLFFTLLERNFKCTYVHEAAVMHPVRTVPWGISLYQQRKNMFNALLYKKHHRLYRQRIEPSPPWQQHSIIGALLIVVLATLCNIWPLNLFAGCAWLFMTILFCLQRLYKTSHTPAHCIEMLVTSILIPPLALFWRLWGMLKFHTLFL
jgi:glycosyltransferase involved in cell wall biosynthesis